MDRWPRISIVTPSFNQGKYIAESIESVMAQQYPNLEHIVVDGGSTDGTLDILKRFPHLEVISEPDGGQADAINKGFGQATGDIWGFLNSDDTLLPGALNRVAQEIDPRGERHIVMGRCRFIDEHGRVIGIEHPSHFESHRRVLEIWKGHMIPQPAVFWTSEVWRTCGPMDEASGYHWLDYDLFCRFSARYRFHFVDQVLANYRLHSESKTMKWTEADRLEDTIPISRRYWGSPLSLMYWQLTVSLAWFRFNRTGRGRRLLREAQEAWQRRNLVQALPKAMAATLLAPEVTFYVLIYPCLRSRGARLVKSVFAQPPAQTRIEPQTAVYMDHTDAWEDGWAGPRLVVSREAGPGVLTVFVQGWVDLRHMKKPLVLTVRMDGQEIHQKGIEKSGGFRMELPLSQPLLPGPHTVEVQASTWFVPHRFIRNGDLRPLAWRLGEVRLG